jgi:VCBS repeat-containing protein
MLAVVNGENLATRLVFYTASVARGDLAAAIAAGACGAISMRERPETLLRSLRLVAPPAGRATAGNEKNGASGENGLAALTDQERKIMRLVAYGMSNKEIARHLKVSAGTVKAQLDHISAQLEIKNRTEIAAFALARLYGGIGALAALIFAALDDVQAANKSAVGDTSSDTFTVVAADGSTEVVTITVNSKKSPGAPGNTARAVNKAGRAENSEADTPARAGKLIGSSVDMAAVANTSPALNSPRPGVSSYGTFMMTAVGIWIYELVNSAAQALGFRDSLTGAFASATTDGTKEVVPLNIPGSADPKLDGFDIGAWLNPETYHQSFVFEAPRSDIITSRSDEPQIIDAEAGGDNFSRNGNPHVGSGTIDALIDHGGFEVASATDASSNAERDTTRATAADESNHGQSQRDLQTAEEGAAAAKQHAKHDGAGDESNHGQSQHDSHAAEEGAAAAKQHAKHDGAGDESNHGQSQRDLHAAEEGAAAAKQHAKHDPAGDESNRGQSQSGLHASKDDFATAQQHGKDDARPGNEASSGQSPHDVHETPVNASKNLHSQSSQNIGKGQAADDSGHAQAAAAPELGDSFHFNNEMPTPKASHILAVQMDHGTDSIKNGLHITENVPLTLIPDADLIGHSGAEQSAVDHAKGAQHHHLAHDLFV